jgi:DNA-binding transcriptional LysR family regulator
MQLPTLKIFCDLVELGSFSAAGARNKITQSAVSQQIRGLEEEFGVSFFERGKKKFSVTPEGRAFEQVAREIMALVDGIGGRLRSSGDVVGGSLRISTIYSIGLHDLPAKLHLFRADHPDVAVKVAYKRSPHVYEDVQGDRADIGLVAYPVTDGAIIADLFDEDEMVVVCHPSHKLARKKKVRLKELSGESYVGFDPDTPTMRAIDRALRQHRVAFVQRNDFDSIESVKRAVEVAGVVSIVPRRTVEKDLKDGRLCALKIEDATLKRPLGIIRKRGKIMSPALRAFFRTMMIRRKPI